MKETLYTCEADFPAGPLPSYQQYWKGQGMKAVTLPVLLGSVVALPGWNLETINMQGGSRRQGS